MSFLKVTWRSIGSIGKGQSTPGCEDSTQDLPRGASPSPTLPKDFDSSKHISCEMPTIFPETPLGTWHGHDLHPMTTYQLMEPIVDSVTHEKLSINDPLRRQEVVRIGLKNIAASHLTFCGTESPGTLLNIPYSNIVERLHYGSQNFIATPFTDVSVALTNSTYVSIFWKKNPRNITMRVPGRFIKNNTDELVTAIMLAKEKPLDVTFNIGEDSQYLTILNLLCHRLITSNRVATLCAEEIIGVTLILIAGSSDHGLACPTVRSFNTIAILVSLLVHWDVIRGSINEASMIDYEGLVLAVNAF
ncbi:hypothetical protein BU17DRAFT_69727 [Hysterangium stoloniferum]|nr:hypothetical protein BU17DRAFT_69727 [Hysterangium stoloniferum]